MQIVAILNEKAGTVAQAGSDTPLTPDGLRALFAAAGVDADVRFIAPERICDEVRAVMAQPVRPDALVIGGGDGTTSCTAGLLVDSELPLGVLPLGTLNHFAKDLGMPEDLAACVGLIAARHVRAVDVAEVNGQVFINNCSVGAYPAAVQRREALRRTHGHGKWRAMAVATLAVLRQVRRLHVQLDVDGATVARRTPFVLVSNNRYSGALFSRSLRARLDGGEICSYTTRVHRFFPLLRLACATFVKGLDNVEDLELRSGREMTLALREKSPRVALDGEVVKMNAPLRFRTRPGALRVLAPPQLPAE